MGIIDGIGKGFVGDLITEGLRFWGEHEEAKNTRDAQAGVDERNAALQREFAQMGIQWKVEDAKKAGIHPLAALGATTQGASPSFQMSGAMPHPGQNISRAIRSTQNAQERLEGELRLENMRLQNTLLTKQILEASSRPGNPPMPTAGTDNFIDGQGDSGTMLVVPSKRVAHAPGRPAQEAGARPDVSFSRSDTGLVPVIPEGLSESMEDDMVGKILWRIRNQVMPNFTGEGAPPTSQLPQGADRWRWDHVRQQWYPAKYDGLDRLIQRARKWDSKFRR